MSEGSRTSKEEICFTCGNWITINGKVGYCAQLGEYTRDIDGCGFWCPPESVGDDKDSIYFRNLKALIDNRFRETAQLYIDVISYLKSHLFDILKTMFGDQLYVLEEEIEEITIDFIVPDIDRIHILLRMEVEGKDSQYIPVTILLEINEDGLVEYSIKGHETGTYWLYLLNEIIENFLLSRCISNDAKFVLGDE